MTSRGFIRLSRTSAAHAAARPATTAGALSLPVRPAVLPPAGRSARGTPVPLLAARKGCHPPPAPAPTPVPAPVRVPRSGQPVRARVKERRPPVVRAVARATVDATRKPSHVMLHPLLEHFAGQGRPAYREVGIHQGDVAVPVAVVADLLVPLPPALVALGLRLLQGVYLFLVRLFADDLPALVAHHDQHQRGHRAVLHQGLDRGERGKVDHARRSDAELSGPQLLPQVPRE